MVKCGNNGCGKEFEEGSKDECCFHPGSAVFHEGSKGWSCCKPRVLDFDDFLKIPGCATGSHKKADPKPQSKPIVQSSTTNPDYIAPSTTKPHPSDKFTPKPISNNNNNNNNKDINSSNNRSTPTLAQQFQKPPIEYVEENDAEDAVIAVGTRCCRNGCSTGIYKDNESRKEQCNYHPGEPVFHEGSKGWSCCKPKAAIFEEFLKIKGCKNGKHRFVPPPKDNNVVECRHDWYQSFDSVLMTIYAKAVDKDNSKIQFLDNKTVSVDLKLAGDKVFKKVYNLAGAINPETSRFDVLKTKIEFKLMKDPQESWSRLEIEEQELYRYQV
ncbi:hypothetical protein ACTFIY_001194 [Dictyostelium cf. discoideum]